MSAEALYAEMARLRAENEELRGRLRELQRALDRRVRLFPSQWGLDPSEARLLALLVDHGVLAYERAAAAMWQQTLDYRLRRKLSVYACRLRQKIAGVAEFRTLNGTGFEMDQASRARVRLAEEARSA